MTTPAPQSPAHILRIKNAVRARDGHCCTECGMSQEEHVHRYGRVLDVHRVNPGSAYALDASCITLCKRCHGPKRRSALGASKLVTVKIDGAVFRKAKMAAVHQRVPIVLFLHRILGPLVEAEYQQLRQHFTAS